ncbi:MAG: deoxyguanosinetriphosphate triphosphohydrolase [Candidatus Omnitrophica bacterium CG11_big_fil_rev_8_21_14_0_20_45_26]|uniref:Deoxyguanosinetriphosphate triphosphohydrolase-like protein n=1 Tax=Candidatus Abzuiibacterium crystallinum TaxID=1974748 RepID=A0A2H0LRI1_9BACT|nr:MAG: deoxyguanosinetriphosphate triphosphohydrolase [Candidatus Omnitrophica bacterium CG11_big_fil_rev_8_21_14_0_20_45_26]PIW64299.1 MAG: deoxyguanosinetriphosphate triphosphohydrolase [Candidatus Omnitrophica bacterium CG12_big_fil_rev_8_21_14_0_65_45_16]
MTLITRANIEERERQWLRPAALRSGESQGRRYTEKEHDYRTAFQRDRDRIIHSTAFRRLEYKTQVFVNHEGDHYRTRLTHTLETNQIARTIGRVLRLNEDLIECIALAHDLGHGPFGHAGQDALQVLMKQYGGFEHNQQCLRIVELLEDNYSTFPGLNLTAEVRDGLRKHQKKAVPSLEAQVVDLADEIAYDSHDLDDGLRAGYFHEKDLDNLKLWKKNKDYLRRHKVNIQETHGRKAAIRLIINQQVNDLLKMTERQLARFKNVKPSVVRAKAEEMVRFSPQMKRDKAELKRFLHRELYHHYRVVRMTDKGKRFIENIFRAYLKEPMQLPPGIRLRLKTDPLERVICDYVAGMTDRFALDEYKRLFEPYERV